MTIVRVFRNPAYCAIAIGIGLLLWLVAVWAPNSALLRIALSSEHVRISDTLGNSFAFFIENFSPAARILTILSSLLAGVASALIIFLVRLRLRAVSTVGLGIAGMMTSLLGVGCAACGAFLISAIFGLGVGSAVTAFLPLHGLEFGILGVVILSATIAVIAKKIREPIACTTKP